jgi:Flp pilus assembly protein TadD
MRFSALPLLLLALAACQSTPEPTTPVAGPGSSAAPGGPAPPPAGKPASDADADFTEVEAAISAGDAARAGKASAAALARSPKSPKAHYYAGVAAELAGQREPAEKHYRDSLALAPGLVDAAINLSAILLDTKREADAVALLRPLQAKSPDDPLLAGNLAVALAATGDHAQAAALYGKLVQKDPKPETRLALAGELIASGKKDEGARALRDGLAQLGDNRDLLAAFGRALAQAGAFEDAIKTLDQALKLKASADLLTYRALFKRSLKDLAGARADLEAALKEDPKFAHAYVYLGELHEQEKKPAEAKKAYEKAIEIAPDSPAGKRAKEKLQALKGAKK